MLERDMKLNIYNLFILLCLFLVSCTNLNKDASIYGKWQGVDNDKELSFIFNSDRTCVLKFVDKELNMIDQINGKYELDFSKKPTALTIRNIPQLSHRLHTIVEFIGVDSSLRLRHRSE